MPPVTQRIENEAELAPFAARVAAVLKPGDMLALYGTLGAGKTALSRALIRHLLDNPDEEVPSPTFTLVQMYDAPDFTLWHFDLYRLEDEERDILELGWEEARRGGVALVEWPERLGSLLPANRLEINIDFDKHDLNENGQQAAGDARVITLTGHGAWAARLADF
ncbi:MAG TPA: tRNA (adenosine(37)-N6)-threonylcarbamoyltransferase complex ATPase subunit type 1 TsaE [Alphaproteobacteria bacterium]|nr:tRNA (adenosine(37)-N6)-threonylcarbamoyltransferase complex ATPase subunit type 1 TsaE [Alphaproteobacteria bacterium]